VREGAPPDEIDLEPEDGIVRMDARAQRLALVLDREETRDEPRDVRRDLDDDLRNGLRIEVR